LAYVAEMIFIVNEPPGWCSKIYL